MKDIRNQPKWWRTARRDAKRAGIPFTIPAPNSPTASAPNGAGFNPAGFTSAARARRARAAHAARNHVPPPQGAPRPQQSYSYSPPPPRPAAPRPSGNVFAQFLASGGKSLQLAAAVLGIIPVAPLQKSVVRAAWVKLITLHHPDRGGSTEAAQAVNAAYSLLKNFSN